MIRISLPDDDLQRLEAVFREATDANRRHRVPIVRMAHRGRRHPDLAADTAPPRGGSTPTSTAGSTPSTPGRHPGRSPSSPPDRAPVLRQWVIDGPAKHGLDRANGTYAERADHLNKNRGVRVGKPALQAFGTASDRTGRPTDSSAATRPNRPRPGRRSPPSKRGGSRGTRLVEPGRGPVPEDPDPHRDPRGEGAPTDRRDVGRQAPAVRLRRGQPGHGGGPREQPGEPEDAKKKTGKARRMPEAFAAHLRHVARVYPADRHKRVVPLIDNAPWHRGKPIDEALRDHPHLEFQRLPRDSPQLNPIERFGKILRRRATHNRLFDTLADLKTSIRNSVCYFQTMRRRIKTLLDRKSKKRTHSTGS